MTLLQNLKEHKIETQVCYEKGKSIEIIIKLEDDSIEYKVTLKDKSYEYFDKLELACFYFENN